MRVVVVGALVLCAFFVMGMWNDAQPNAEGVVQRPRAQVYASLARQYAAVEAKAQRTHSVTGDPPVPVAFTFDREDDKMLSLTAKAGWRTIKLKTWLEDGPGPNQTRIKVLFEPESMRERSGAGSGDLAATIETILWRTETQLGDGKRAYALFGGAPERQDSGYSSHDYNSRLDPSSGAPTVEAKPMTNPRGTNPNY
jgi:hypothetical protein